MDGEDTGCTGGGAQGRPAGPGGRRVQPGGRAAGGRGPAGATQAEGKARGGPAGSLSRRGVGAVLPEPARRAGRPEAAESTALRLGQQGPDGGGARPWFGPSCLLGHRLLSHRGERPSPTSARRTRGGGGLAGPGGPKWAPSLTWPHPERGRFGPTGLSVSSHTRNLLPGHSGGVTAMPPRPRPQDASSASPPAPQAAPGVLGAPLPLPLGGSAGRGFLRSLLLVARDTPPPCAAALPRGAPGRRGSRAHGDGALPGAPLPRSLRPGAELRGAGRLRPRTSGYGPRPGVDVLGVFGEFAHLQPVKGFLKHGPVGRDTCSRKFFTGGREPARSRSGTEASAGHGPRPAGLQGDAWTRRDGGRPRRTRGVGAGQGPGRRAAHVSPFHCVSCFLRNVGRSRHETRSSGHGGPVSRCVSPETSRLPWGPAGGAGARGRPELRAAAWTASPWASALAQPVAERQPHDPRELVPAHSLVLRARMADAALAERAQRGAGFPAGSWRGG